MDLLALSKVVSHVLRHEPWLYELELDDEGWVSVGAVIDALRSERSEWSDLSEADIERMIAASSRRRHEIRGGRIRALYGHTIPGQLRKVAAVPPGALFHGTAAASVPGILSSGLLPMGRQYVHLSADEATACKVGHRKTSLPIILRVLAGDAHASGIHFYEGNEIVWLADCIPAKFILFD